MSCMGPTGCARTGNPVVSNGLQGVCVATCIMPHCKVHFLRLLLRLLRARHASCADARKARANHLDVLPLPWLFEIVAEFVQLYGKFHSEVRVLWTARPPWARDGCPLCGDCMHARLAAVHALVLAVC